MSARETTCCFTGHRPVKLPWNVNEDDPRCLSLKAQISTALEGIYDTGYRTFYVEWLSVVTPILQRQS